MRTPRFAPVLLAALLLAGCTAAPAASGDAAASAEAAPASSEAASAEPAPAAESTEAAEEAAATASTEPLRLLQTGDEKQYYLTEPANADQTLERFRIVDLTTGENAIPCDVEGCTHDSEDCPAVWSRATWDFGVAAWVLDEDTLLILSSTSEPNKTVFSFADRNCQNLTPFATVEDAMGIAQQCTDGTSLYFLMSIEGGTYKICRLSLADGSQTVLWEGTEYPAPGVIGRNFVLKTSDLTYPEPTGDLGADATALPTGTVTHSLLNVDTGELRELYTYSSDAWNLDNLDAYVVDGQYYQIDRAAGTLSTVDPDTGEVRQISDGLPTADRNTYTSDYQPEAVLDGWMVFYRLPVIVNVETGEVRQRIDLPENYWNGYGHQPSIYLQLQDRLLVDCRYEPYTRTGIGTDGTPYTINTERSYLGLISIDDFLNGVPNYTEVCQRPD